MYGAAAATNCATGCCWRCACCCWLLVVLAFAGPLWRIVNPAGATGGAALHVIASTPRMSMKHDGIWERAQQRATELAAAVRGADRVMLVAADHRLRVLQEPVFAGQAGALRAAIAALKPGYSRLDYGALVSRLSGLGRRSRANAWCCTWSPTCSSRPVRCALRTCSRRPV